MAILNFTLSQVGETGQAPKFIYLDTNNTLAQVSATGFLNKFVAAGNKVSETDMAVVSTRTTPSAKTAAVSLFNVTYLAGNWSLTSNATPLALSNGQIFVGNASGVATGVTLSGDATVTNTGVITIANNAITTAKIANANVTLAKLASGVTPATVVKFFGKAIADGGSPEVVIPVVGVLSTDIAFAQFQTTSNPASIRTVIPSTNTITVTADGDPGAGATVSYQVFRAAA